AMAGRDAYETFFISRRRRHTSLQGDWSSDVCSSDLQRMRGKQVRAESARLKRSEPRRGASKSDVGGGFALEHLAHEDQPAAFVRSEERRVGKECRARSSAADSKERTGKIMTATCTRH